LLFIDKSGNNHGGILIDPVKVQNINNNQALFTVELDKEMNGINPVTGERKTLQQINGLALYNDGNNPVQFKSGNIAALTATFTK
jgi:hypothetical protein